MTVSFVNFNGSKTDMFDASKESIFKHTRNFMAICATIIAHIKPFPACRRDSVGAWGNGQKYMDRRFVISNGDGG